MNEQLLKTSGADVLSSSEKTQKNLPVGLVDATPPPQLPHLVRCTSEGKYNDYKFYTIWEISAIWLAQSSGISA